MFDRDGKIAFSFEAWLLRHNPDQRWAYFSNMTPDEALIFKTHDTDPAAAHCVPHGAFDHPHMPAATWRRESASRCAASPTGSVIDMRRVSSIESAREDSSVDPAWPVGAARLIRLQAAIGVRPIRKKILFLAGPRDHGIPGRHEYERDLKTLAQSLEQSSNLHGVTTQLIVGTLPRDLAAVQDVAAIVIESSSDRAADETHPLFPPNPSTNGRGYDPDTTAYLKALDDLIRQKQIGVVILHYANWAENWRAREYYLELDRRAVGADRLEESGR